jgi:hypothetical protein
MIDCGVLVKVEEEEDDGGSEGIQKFNFLYSERHFDNN